MFARFMARQLACPTGLVGRWILGPLWNRRNVALNDAAFEALTPAATDRILEVGFGGGYLVSRLACVVTAGMLAGVDVSPVIVERGRRRYRRFVHAGRFDLRCAQAESLPFAPASFTKVCTVNSAFYWHDVAGAFAEARRVLVAGGRLVVCLTCRASLERKRFVQHGVRLFEPAELESLLARVGFEQVCTRHAADRHREFFTMVATKQQ